MRFYNPHLNIPDSRDCWKTQFMRFGTWLLVYFWRGDLLLVQDDLRPARIQQLCSQINLDSCKLHRCCFVNSMVSSLGRCGLMVKLEKVVGSNPSGADELYNCETSQDCWMNTFHKCNCGHDMLTQLMPLR